MKVKKKAREQTAMEKRNTSIVNFVLVALVPVLLCILLGFSLRQSNIENKENSFKKVKALEAERDSIKNKIGKLTGTFFKADTILNRFNRNDFKILEQSLKAADNPIAFNNWEIDRAERISKLRSSFRTVENDEDFKEEDDARATLDFGKKWLQAFSDTKDKELFAMKQIRQNEVGVQMDQLLQDQIDNLKKDLTAKDLEISKLEIKLLQSQGQKIQLEQGSEKDTKAIEKELEDIKSNNGKLKEKIETQVSRAEKILSDLKEKGIFRKTEEIQAFKKDLDEQLKNIRDELLELEIE
ncbi:MAG: hypothetical protein R2824_07110 [Saprospiraceae bacterium]|nr:hypothetical protein [Lewinella sp.]